jgi:hypothetical protein
MSRIALQYAVTTLAIGAAVTSARSSAGGPSVFHACYVPLTGTVYRIKETNLKPACTSPSHVEFSWTDGAGAIRTGDAASGDLTGVFPNPAVAALQGRPVGATAPTNGQVLSWNGSAWSPTTLNSAALGVEVVLNRSATVNPGQMLRHTVHCPAGKMAISGGVSIDVDWVWVQSESGILNTTLPGDWQVAVVNNSSLPDGFWASAVCVNAN